ncbi:MAG TPA: ECF-type sigma factor [Burkholderiaceae bacterium]|nr:ECF-type sigma factor [Burkholderiaceae bacterium]
MATITVLLERARGGEVAARDELFSASYNELKRLARARLRDGGRNTVLDTTALVHESYLRFLSILLYELVTGTRPARRGAGATVADQDTTPASQATTDLAVRKLLRGDVDTILGKALKPSPGDRYSTVDALVADIERHLAGQPVLARPDTATYRMGKFARRHRAAAGATCIVLVAVIASAAISLLQARRSGAEAERARLVKESVVDVFRTNTTRERPKDDELRHLPAELLLGRAVRQIERQFAQQPELEAELLGAMGSIFLGLGQGAHAAEIAAKQLAALDRFEAPAEQRAQAVGLLARAQIHDQRLDEAVATLKRGLGTLPERNAREAAELRALLGWALVLRQEFATAEKELDIAEATLAKATGLDSPIQADILFARAQILYLQQRFQEAQPGFRRAIEIATRTESETSPRVVEMQRFYAFALLLSNQAAEGQRTLDQLIAKLRESEGDSSIEAAALELEMLRMLARLDTWRNERTIQRLERIKVTFDGQGARVPRHWRAYADFSLGWALYWNGQVARGGRLMTTSGELLLDYQQDVASRQEIKRMLADALCDAGFHERVVQLTDENYEETRSMLGDDHPRTRVEAGFSAFMHAWAGDFRAADERLASGFRNFAAAEGDDAWASLALLGNAGIVRYREGRFAESLQFLERWRDTNDRLDPGGAMRDGDQAVTLANFGRTLCHLGRIAAGAEALERSVALYAKQHETSPFLAEVRAQLGLCLLSAGRRGRAAELASLARKAFDAQPAVSPNFKEPLLELERQLLARRQS